MEKAEIRNMKAGNLQKDARDKPLSNHNNRFNCQQCGECCRELSGTITASYDDLKKWRDLNRDDILQYCEICLPDGSWINGVHWDGRPISGCDIFDEHPPRGCPFLRKVRNKKIYKCTIYNIRPEVCRVYPMKHNGICLGAKEKEAS